MNEEGPLTNEELQEFIDHIKTAEPMAGWVMIGWKYAKRLAITLENLVKENKTMSARVLTHYPQIFNRSSK